MIVARAGLAHRVHGQHGITHVNALDVDLTGQDIAQGRAASHVTVVHEVLERGTGFLAQALEDRCRVGVAHVLAVGVHLDARAAAQGGMVGRVIFLGIVGMESMGIVSRHHERTVNGASKVLKVASQCHDEPEQHVAQHGRVGALLGAAARLLVVKDGCYQRRVFVLGLGDGRDGGMHHAQVIEAAG